MKKLILLLYVCCSFSNLASSDDLWAYNGCHMAELRCGNAQRDCSNAQFRASGNAIDNFRGYPADLHYISEAERAKREAERICSNANMLCSERHRICAEERGRAEQERARANRGL